MSAKTERFTDEFLKGYLKCALWSGVDDNGEPLDARFTVNDFTKDAVAEARRECKRFIALAGARLAATSGTASQHGYDFWLTRNGHGSGFWDRGYGPVGELLSRDAKPFGMVHVWVTRRGKLAF